MRRVPVHLAVRVGSTTSSLRALVELKAGERLALDRAIGEPFDLIVEGREVATVIPVASEERVTIQLANRLEEDDRG